MLEKGGLNKDSGYQTAHITGGHEANLWNKQVNNDSVTIKTEPTSIIFCLSTPTLYLSKSNLVKNGEGWKWPTTSAIIWTTPRKCLDKPGETRKRGSGEESKKETDIKEKHSRRERQDGAGYTDWPRHKEINGRDDKVDAQTHSVGRNTKGTQSQMADWNRLDCWTTQLEHGYENKCMKFYS